MSMVQDNLSDTLAVAEKAPARSAASIEDYRRRVDEMGRIILAYSDATDRMQQQQDELTRKVEQLQLELSEKNKQLERRNRLAALGEMAAGIAHEIRNPLGGIKLYTSLLKTDVADRPDAQRTVGKMVNAIGRMESIVSQVLYFAREIRASPMECDLVDLVQESIELARTRKTDCDIEISLSAPKALRAKVDAHLMTQALVNLLSNSIDACGERGTIDVSITKEKKGKTRLRIDDSGPGLPADVIEKVFHPFFTTKADGTGLGLAIVHRIVEAHEGTIEAKNRDVGGARFELVI
jgi:signal transduction histidine kinase